MPRKVSFVTSNVHKFEEAKTVLTQYDIELIQIPTPVLEIQSEDLREIVIYKVMEAVKVVDPPFIVEDTGLYISELNGFPGPYASYVYKSLGLTNILKLMRNISNRAATFRAVGAVVYRENVFKIFESIVGGTIAENIRGDQGFGYDPIFIPNGSTHTFAEMDVNEKNKYSHRGKLFRKIGSFLTQVI